MHVVYFSYSRRGDYLFILVWLYCWQIKKSMIATEAAHPKGSAGQASGSAKGSQAKIPFNVIGSPNLKNP